MRIYADLDRPWHHPGVYPIAPDVFRIPLALPDPGLHSVNVYAIVDGEELVLIDSGQALASSRETLEGALDVLGFGLHQVRDFLVTHIHRDHYTQAIALRREFGTRIRLGAAERPSFAIVADSACDRFVSQLALLEVSGAKLLAEQIAGTDDGIHCDLWEEPDVWLFEEAIELHARTLSCLPTPGHTRGHVVFRDDIAGLSFTGDHVLPHITPSIGFEPAVRPLPLADYLDSLRLVRKLPDTWLLPAHGGVGRSVHSRIEDLLEHHAQRLESTVLRVSDVMTAYDVARQLTWTRRSRTFCELSVFNQMLAVLETKAHLDVLVVAKRLRVHAQGGVNLYYRL